MIDVADREATRIMLAELRDLESWLARAVLVNTDYANACDLAIELRRRLGLPEAS